MSAMLRHPDTAPRAPLAPPAPRPLSTPEHSEPQRFAGPGGFIAALKAGYGR